MRQEQLAVLAKGLRAVLPSALADIDARRPPQLLEGSSVVLRPLARGDEAELRRIHATTEVARWWDAPGESFPWEEPEATRLTILVGGAIAGLIEFHEELEPKYRHASIDLFLDPALHGRGLGSETVGLLVRHLIEDRGHHRVVIDPASTNIAAIRAYERVGFKPVGIMRQAERDPEGSGWHDTLLMELLAEEIRHADR